MITVFSYYERAVSNIYGVLLKLQRLYYTLYYLRPIQIYARFWLRLYRPKPNFSTPPPLSSPANDWLALSMVDSTFKHNNTFTFLNETHELRQSTDWNHKQWHKLWLYNLHYFDDLNAIDSNERLFVHKDLVKRWIVENPPAIGNGWEPYPLSLRIVNWIKWSLRQPSVTQANLIQQSLAVQIRYLRRRLEYHLLGNHLFANAKALVFAGAFFENEEANQWLEKGLSLVTDELDEQILADGGHFELSPMYHCVILNDVLDLINIANVYTNRIDKYYRQAWQKTAVKMLKWLSAMIHPDGDIALFNDAAFQIAAKPKQLNDYANQLMIFSNIMPDDKNVTGITVLQHYARLENKSSVLIADIGEVGPRYLCGHAHADTLSFEFSLFGKRIIVDSGTSCYGNDAERLRQRSTAAHNTVEVNGQNSSEVWAGFRVARRAHPLAVKQSLTKQALTLEAGHTGYQRLDESIIHKRKWSLKDISFSVYDQIDGNFTSAIGRLLFAPDITIKCGNQANNWRLYLLIDDQIRQLSLQFFGVNTSLEKATYHPKFGVSEQTTVLLYRLEKSKVHWTLRWQN